jgi:hypothetical protein
VSSALLSWKASHSGFIYLVRFLARSHLYSSPVSTTWAYYVGEFLGALLAVLVCESRCLFALRTRWPIPLTCRSADLMLKEFNYGDITLGVDSVNPADTLTLHHAPVSRMLGRYVFDS